MRWWASTEVSLEKTARYIHDGSETWGSSVSKAETKRPNRETNRVFQTHLIFEDGTSQSNCSSIGEIEAETKSRCDPNQLLQDLL